MKHLIVMRYITAFCILIVISNVLLLSISSAINSYEDLGPSLVINFDKAIAVDKPRDLKIDENGGSIIADGVLGQALRLGKGEYLAIDCSNIIESKSGTLLFWVRPHWNYYEEIDRLISHAFVSWTWNDKKRGYFVLSNGWWEPAGAPYTYLIANNQDFSHIRKSIFYKKGEWNHFACVWQAGNPGSIELYHNGKLVTQKGKFMKESFGIWGPLYLGCDYGTSQKNNRWAVSDFDELAFFDRVLSIEEIISIYKQQIPDSDEDLLPSYDPERDEAGNILETRAIFDEGVGWQSEEGAYEIIGRIKEAGFNVYIPCVWHGKGSRFPTGLSVPEKGLDFSNGDSLGRLITIAHENGIEVHPWFCVALRQREFLQEFYSNKTPEKAFDVHRPQFRKYITSLILDVVKRYKVDGVLLDYIRTMGVCTCNYCVMQYKTKYGRDLHIDMRIKTLNGGLEPHLQQWQDEAVESIVKNISTEVKKLNPDLVVSVYGHPTPSFLPPSTQGRRELKWSNKGLIDVIYSGDYRQDPDFEKHNIIHSEKNPSAKLILLLGNYDKTLTGKVIPRKAEILANLVSHSQRQWPGGVGIYLYSMLNNEQVRILSHGPFSEPALSNWKE